MKPREREHKGGAGMELQVRVEEVRGVEHRELALSGGRIVEWRDGNAVGKTTVAAVVAACLGRDPDPLGIGKPGAYVRREAEPERCCGTVACDGWAIRWTPGEEGRPLQVEGDAPRAPLLAVWDAKSWTQGTRAERSVRWLDAVQAVSRGPEVVDAIRANGEGLDESRIEALANTIAGAEAGREEEVWAWAEEQAKGEAKARREQWEGITARAGGKERFSVKLGTTWRPPGWDPKWEGEDADKARAGLTRAGKAVEAAVALRNRAEAAHAEEARRRRDAEGRTQRRAALAAEKGRLESQEQAARAKAAEAAEPEQAAQPDLEALEAARSQAWDRARKAQEGVEQAEAAVRAGEEALRGEKARRRTWREAAEALAAAEGGAETCPTCGQRWEEKVRENARVVGDAKEALAKLGADPGDEGVRTAQRTLEDARQAAADAARARDAAQGEARKAEQGLKDAEAAAEAMRGREREEREAARRAEGEGEARRRRLAEIAGALKEIEAQEAAEPAAAPMEWDLEEVRAAERTAAGTKEEAERTVRNVEAVGEAGRAAKEEAGWRKLAAALGTGEKGIRSQRRAQAVEGLRKWVSRLAGLAGFEGRVTVTAQGQVEWAGRPLEWCSEGERWVAMAVVRAAVTARCEVPVLVLDGAERLAPDWREKVKEGIRRMAEGAGIAVLWLETGTPGGESPDTAGEDDIDW